MANSLVQQFQQLSAVLQQYKPYWQLLPFTCDALPWQQPDLIQSLLSLSAKQVNAIDLCSQLQQQYFADLFPQLYQLTELYSLPCNDTVLPVAPFWLANGIAGRKLEQIDALCRQWQPSQLPVLEWCAGKGHLGRMLAYRFDQTVTSIEWQQQLCDDGTALAAKHHIAQQFVCADVLTAPLNNVLHSQQHIVALHACGQLHISMLQHAVQHGCQQLQLVPCCYHLISEAQYQPMSNLGTELNLQLSKDDLKLVVQGQVTAGERVEKLRFTEVLWRLAYDELRADISADKQYRPLASVAKHWFSGEFANFALWAAQQHQLRLPAEIDWALYLQRGTKRAGLVQRIELVRHLFRRPLELWLVLDRALYLQQHGYDVSVTQLCNYQITPRNVLLSATKQS